MAYTTTFAIALGPAYAGLTLAAQLVDTAGADVGGEITAGFVELSDGYYTLTASIPDGHRGAVKVYEDGALTPILGVGSINPEELENADAKTSTRATPDQVGAEVWGYGTRTLTQPANASTDGTTPGEITRTRGNRWSISITGLGSLAGRDALWWTAKRRPESQADSEAVIMITEADGLVVLNGAVDGDWDASDGTLAVDDEDAGDITITLAGLATALLSPRLYQYDVQVLPTGAIGPDTPDHGTLTVLTDVTRATEA